MKAAVVGGSGFVGGHVVDKLMADGHEVVIVDQVPPTVVRDPVPRWVLAGVGRRDELKKVFDGCQVVFHLAAVSNTTQAKEDPVLATHVNCLGTVNVLTEAVLQGVERVVVAGSSLVSNQMVSDQADGACSEFAFFDSLLSQHPYVVSKVFTEMITQAFPLQYDIDTTVFRYGIQYGERMTPGVVAHSFITRALAGQPIIIHGDGEQWRQYVYVGDIADAHVNLISQWDASADGLYNLVGPEKVSILDMAKTVQELIPGTVIEHGPARQGDIAVRFCTADEAKKDLAWEATTTLKEGLSRTVDWYRSQA